MKKSEHPNDCQKINDEGLLELYLIDGIDQSEKNQVEEHLTRCADCRTLFDESKNMETFIRDSLKPSSITDLEDRVVHAYRQHLTPQRRRRYDSFVKVAACLMAAVVLGAVIDQDASHEQGLSRLSFSDSLDKRAHTSPAQINGGISLEDHHNNTLRKNIYGFKNSEQSMDALRSQAESYKSARTSPARSKTIDGKRQYAAEVEEADEDMVLMKDIETQNHDDLQGDFYKSPSLPTDQIGGFASDKGGSYSQAKEKKEGEWAKEPMAVRKAMTANELMAQIQQGEGGGNGSPVLRKEQSQRLDELNDMELPRAAKAGAPKKMRSHTPGNSILARDNTEDDKPTASNSLYNKLIKTAEATYEVENYVSTVNRLKRLAEEHQGYLANENSTKGANGKMQGTLTFRIKAVNFDSFMTALLGIGDQKRQKVDVRDVTKNFHDMQAELESLESRKKALDKALEERKGDLKAFVEFEAKQAEVLSKINKIKGELKYMSHQVAFSTLHLGLIETGVNQAAVLVHKEDANMHLAVPEVDGAFNEVKKRAEDLGAQVCSSRFNTGKTREQITAHLVIKAKTSIFSELLKALGEMGYVSTLTRKSADTSENGDVAHLDAKRQEGMGTLTLMLYHLPDFVVDNNFMEVFIDQVPDVYRQINDMESEDFEILDKEIDSFTDEAKRCRFSLKITKEAYAEFATRLRDFGQVNTESGTPTPARNANGDPLPDFQRRVVMLNVHFKTLDPIVTDSLSLNLEAKDVQKAFRHIKQRAREKGYEIKHLQIDDDSSRAKNAQMSFVLKADSYDTFSSFLTEGNDTVGHVAYKQTHSLSDTPEKLKDVPAFQERQATVSINIRKLEPFTKETRELQLKKSHDVTVLYRELKAKAQAFAGARLVNSSFTPQSHKASLSVSVPHERFEEFITGLTEKFDGKVTVTNSWERPVDSKNPIPAYRTREGLLTLNLEKFQPIIYKKAELKLFAKDTVDLLKKAEGIAHKAEGCEILLSQTKTEQDLSKTSTLQVRMSESAFESFVNKFKGLVSEGDMLQDNIHSTNNTNNPDYDGEWKVGVITLNLTNSRAGALAPGGAQGYFAQLIDSFKSGSLMIVSLLFKGLPYILALVLLVMLIKRLQRRLSKASQ